MAWRARSGARFQGGRVHGEGISEITLLRELLEVSELERFKSLVRIAGGIDLVACDAEKRHRDHVDGLESSVVALLGEGLGARKLIEIGSREVTSSS